MNNDSGTVLVVDDELSMREFLEIMLKKQGYQVDTAAGGKEALKSIEGRDYDLIICDIMMPRVDGMEVLRQAKAQNPEVPVIMITAFASTESAVEAMKLGAYDYITKPFKIDEINLIIAKALEKVRLQRENVLLRKELKTKYEFQNIIGNSEPMLQIYDVIRRIAPTRSNVLISGESGTGKELVAKAIHVLSPRKDGHIITVNCGAIPRELMESELFGHRKGSFTGAYQHKRGLFEAAHGGTIFLDEIGEIEPSIQVKLLRVIQDKTFKAVGGLEDILVDVRVIAASNLDLEKAVQEGRFREDLYYRLNVIRVRMPPLRQRKDDVMLLADYFLERYTKELNKPIKKIAKECETLLLSYNYPGNVRELENIIERAVNLEQSNIILPESLPDFLRSQTCSRDIAAGIEFPPGGIELETILNQIELQLINQAIKMAKGVKKDAASLLGISFRSFRYRLEKLGIQQEEEEE